MLFPNTGMASANGTVFVIGAACALDVQDCASAGAAGAAGFRSWRLKRLRTAFMVRPGKKVRVIVLHRAPYMATPRCSFSSSSAVHGSSAPRSRVGFASVGGPAFRRLYRLRTEESLRSGKCAAIRVHDGPRVATSLSTSASSSSVHGLESAAEAFVLGSETSVACVVGVSCVASVATVSGRSIVVATVSGRSIVVKSSATKGCLRLSRDRHAWSWSLCPLRSRRAPRLSLIIKIAGAQQKKHLT